MTYSHALKGMVSCEMCGKKLGNLKQVYNTYPNSPDNISFNFCPNDEVCLRNFIDYVLSKYGKKASKEHKKEVGIPPKSKDMGILETFI